MLKTEEIKESTKELRQEWTNERMKEGTEECRDEETDEGTTKNGTNE